MKMRTKNSKMYDIMISSKNEACEAAVGHLPCAMRPDVLYSFSNII